MDNIDGLLLNAIDMHVHAGPEAFVKRRFDALEVTRQARELGMKSIVLKSHNYPTSPLAYMVNQLVPGIHVYGSLCLDWEVGGINISAVKASVELGAKVIWMPTFSAENGRVAAARLLGTQLRKKGINIVKDDVSQELDDIFQVIVEHDIALATGHLSPEEIFVLMRKAKQVGLSKIIITHASYRVFDKSLKLEEQRQLAQEGAFIEHCFLGLLPTGHLRSPEEMVEAIRAVGAEQCIMSTDLGQYHNPPAPEGMRMFIATMLKYGLTSKEIELMVKANPAKLLGLTLQG